eukprot:scaffold4277_cov24-Tisochrysis_lutea.AAC.2
MEPSPPSQISCCAAARIAHAFGTQRMASNGGCWSRPVQVAIAPRATKSLEGGTAVQIDRGSGPGTCHVQITWSSAACNRELDPERNIALARVSRSSIIIAAPRAGAASAAVATALRAWWPRTTTARPVDSPPLSTGCQIVSTRLSNDGRRATRTKPEAGRTETTNCFSSSLLSLRGGTVTALWWSSGIRCRGMTRSCTGETAPWKASFGGDSVDVHPAMKSSQESNPSESESSLRTASCTCTTVACMSSQRRAE